MEDYVNPAKDVNSNDYWISVISAKWPEAMATLRRAFPQAEWEVLTTTIDSQIEDEDKQNLAKWLAKLSFIFVIDLNETFKHFRSDLFFWENLTALTFVQG